MLGLSRTAVPPALAGPVLTPVVGRKIGKPQGDSPGIKGCSPRRIRMTCVKGRRLLQYDRTPNMSTTGKAVGMERLYRLA
jgi:hypothetical protein